MTSRTLRHLLVCILALAAKFSFADQTIYSDSLLNGWENWSWATVNFAATAPVHGGTRSVAVTTGAWQAIHLHHAAFDSSSCTDLTF